MKSMVLVKEKKSRNS